MIEIVRTNAHHPDFIELVKDLDADLATRDGAAHAFYAAYNMIDEIKYVVLAYENQRPTGCGALRQYGSKTMEIKRMYVVPQKRRTGIASRILLELEHWAAELSCIKCILETGKMQPEALQLYRRKGYVLIPNYGQYAGVENSLCFEKEIQNR